VRVRQAFKDEQGLPSSEAEPAVECQEAGRERRADHVRDRGRGHEEAERLGALRRGEPVGEHLGRRVGHPPRLGGLRWPGEPQTHAQAMVGSF
jgi:hypothetical protein